MLKLHVPRRRANILLYAVVIFVFVCYLGVVIYQGNQAIAKQQSEAQEKSIAMDKIIAAIKEKKAAEKTAAEAAKKQRESSDAALSSQLAGNVVTPAGCAIDGKSAHQNPNISDLVVNKKHCFNPINFSPADLSSFDGYIMSAKIIPDLTALFAAASSAGVPLSITSAYRSYQNQVDTYNSWVKVNGSTAAADTVSARPGYSEHQSGLAVDLSAGSCSLECFLNSPQFTWLAEHAADYGFIQRYPVGLTSITGYSDEAWHYRYVGAATAKDMKAKNIKTLEQYWNITGGSY